MKLAHMMNSQETGQAGMSLKRILTEIRSPTSAGTKFIKYALIAAAGGVIYVKFVKPMLEEREFHRYEQFAHTLHEMEQKQNSKTPPQSEWRWLCFVTLRSGYTS